MSAQIIDGKAIAQKVRSEVAAKVALLKDRKPGLAVILLGEDPASQVYVRNKHKACEEVGIRSFVDTQPATLSEAALLAKIDALNNDPAVDGILVQMPLPKHIDAEKVINRISPEKDVDGFHPINVGVLASGKKAPFVACTPAGSIRLLDEAHVQIEGKIAIVVGRSAIVGRPASMLLLGRDATVIMAHSKTPNLADEVSRADIIVAAVGKPEFIKGAWIKPGAAVIDVGINRVESGKLVGDVEFQAAATRAGHITPVPGGVGPMTIAMLLENTVLSAQRRVGV
jgi:methylenetetrahydrofolate dehydrogenase (NADP+) / methenyltetrahydrofolate cyclohydrolase